MVPHFDGSEKKKICNKRLKGTVRLPPNKIERLSDSGYFCSSSTHSIYLRTEQHSKHKKKK
jgi:hypothetical protein